ncbi:DUF4189 domain-containing protein [Antrihabitans spumae]|uniref:DUF4189 domain-containing protein n=1 Tax=Antrihabitans spumae TaxID=3373370 RepID=A0ABW7KPC3_9NOCA
MKLTNTVARAAAVTAIAAGAVAMAAAPASANSYDNWGAIAISIDTGATAYAIDYGSAGAAESAAVGSCGQYDCQAVVNFANGCGAVAQAPNGAWGWAYAADRAGAEASAIGATPGAGARIITWACTTGHL